MGPCQITKNLIHFDIIKIYNLWRFLYAHTTQLSQPLAIETINIIHSPTVLLFDIDILLITAKCGHSFDILTFDFLLKPPQPSTGLFF